MFGRRQDDRSTAGDGTDLVRLRENRAVGSICCRFFDESGRPCETRQEKH